MRRDGRIAGDGRAEQSGQSGAVAGLDHCDRGDSSTGARVRRGVCVLVDCACVDACRLCVLCEWRVSAGSIDEQTAGQVSLTGTGTGTRWETQMQMQRPRPRPTTVTGAVVRGHQQLSHRYTRVHTQCTAMRREYTTTMQQTVTHRERRVVVRSSDKPCACTVNEDERRGTSRYKHMQWG